MKLYYKIASHPKNLYQYVIQYAILVKIHTHVSFLAVNSRDNTRGRILFVPTVYPRIVRVGAVCSREGKGRGRKRRERAGIRANNVLFRDNE